MWLFIPLAIAGPEAVVLGVAQDAGHPQIACTKSCCTSAWEAGHRVTSVALVDGDSTWLLDASPDLPAQLHQVGDELAGVFLTHAHMGHYTGLMHLGREAMGASSTPVWATARMDAFLRGNAPWSQLVELQNIALSPLVDGVAVSVGSLAVTPFTVPHRDELSDTVGFLVEGPTSSLLYLPDIDKWERWDTPVEEWIARADVALLDGTFFSGDELPGRDMAEIPHPFIVESIERFAVLPEPQRAKVHFTHLNHSNPALQPESDAVQAIEAAGHHVAQEGSRFPL
ncbi:MAG: pyrroloquinoline quinone biosynthesis protein PqqB [Proteobacteria bacterium]|nr:pyrroloquinoline quinone biosynthesis protein PqqB [Pseudomonadota bacterium]MCP4922026.1 pyrroloquinoline quinone biosynthesis protein PqqB [Pseudomonadota bacterium]